MTGNNDRAVRQGTSESESRRLEVQAIRELSDLVLRADGVAAFSEQTLIAQEADRPLPDWARNYLVSSPNGSLKGFAFADLRNRSIELAVDPENRGLGIGTQLLERLRILHPGLAAWAHGNLAPARGLAERLELPKVRELWRMRLSLDSAVAESSLPAGIQLRAFRPGVDDQAWVDLNAAAFASHPEQGKLDLGDLQERMGEAWFDPAGLIIAWDGEDAVGFVWTKQVPGEPGEIYALGIAPGHQGKGLGGTLLRRGLNHLVEGKLDARSVRSPVLVDLYVEHDNEPAVRAYRRVGFEVAAIDAQYGPLE